MRGPAQAVGQNSSRKTRTQARGHKSKVRVNRTKTWRTMTDGRQMKRLDKLVYPV